MTDLENLRQQRELLDSVLDGSLSLQRESVADELLEARRELLIEEIIQLYAGHAEPGRSLDTIMWDAIGLMDMVTIIQRLLARGCVWDKALTWTSSGIRNETHLPQDCIDVAGRSA